MMSFWCSHIVLGVSIVDFEEVKTDWVNPLRF